VFDSNEYYWCYELSKEMLKNDEQLGIEEDEHTAPSEVTAKMSTRVGGA
jgi:hypothetical protein